MEELKKCPICGGNLTIENYNGKEINLKFLDIEKEDEYTAVCSCGFSFGLYDIKLKEFLVRLNTRKSIDWIVYRLEEKLSIARQSSYGNEISLGIASGLNLAIEIVKEEMS